MNINIKCWGNHKPKRGSDGAAGIDLYNNGETVTIREGEVATISTKTSMEIPQGYVGLVIVRSGLGFKGLNLINSVGVIDSDYRGEILVRFILHPSPGSGMPMQERIRQFLRTILSRTRYIDAIDTVNIPIPHNELTLKHGERVAQIVIVPYADLELIFVDELSDTSRGDGGFGSTGSQ